MSETETEGMSDDEEPKPVKKRPVGRPRKRQVPFCPERWRVFDVFYVIYDPFYDVVMWYMIHFYDVVMWYMIRLMLWCALCFYVFILVKRDPREVRVNLLPPRHRGIWRVWYVICFCILWYVFDVLMWFMMCLILFMCFMMFLISYTRFMMYVWCDTWSVFDVCHDLWCV